MMVVAGLVGRLVVPSGAWWGVRSAGPVVELLPVSEGSLVAALHLVGCLADPSGLTWAVKLAT